MKRSILVIAANRYKITGRTFLNYFLNKELKEEAGLLHAPAEKKKEMVE